MKKTLPSTELFSTSRVELHYKRPNISNTHYISCSADGNKILRDYINLHQLDLRECFWVMFLTNANRVLSISETACGTTKEVACNPKYIFQLALLTNASAIILAHNHPSGKLAISESDKAMTKRIKKISQLMGVKLLDHIIITSESFVSMSDKGEL